MTENEARLAARVFEARDALTGAIDCDEPHERIAQLYARYLYLRFPEIAEGSEEE